MLVDLPVMMAVGVTLGFFVGIILEYAIPLGGLTSCFNLPSVSWAMLTPIVGLVESILISLS